VSGIHPIRPNGSYIIADSASAIAKKDDDLANLPAVAHKELDIAGIIWWNGLTRAERVYWLDVAGSAVPADAWPPFRAGALHCRRNRWSDRAREGAAPCAAWVYSSDVNPPRVVRWSAVISPMRCSRASIASSVRRCRIAMASGDSLGAGVDTAPARVMNVFGEARAHHAYLL
jgi:hypothetical protein